VYPSLSYAVAGLLACVAVLALVAIKVPSLRTALGIAMRTGHAAAALVVLVDLVGVLRGHEVDSMLTHGGYMVATVGLPFLLLNRVPETDADGHELPVEPPHPGVVAVCAIAMAVLVWRLQLTW